MDPVAAFYHRHLDANTSGGQTDQTLDVQSLRTGVHRYSAVHDHLKAHPNLRVLELGYGGPNIVAANAPLAERYHIVDIVDRTLGVTLPGNVRAHQANLDRTFPFEDNSFDVVVAMMVIEHLFDPFHAFAEISRVVRIGGDVFVNLPNIAAIRCRLQLLRGKMPITSHPDWFARREWDGGHLHYFTVADVKRIAAENTLETLEVRPVGPFQVIKKVWPSLMCHEITYHFRKRS